MKKHILSFLPGDHPWQNSIYYYDRLPSTNDLAKKLAQEGAPQGTVILAGSQTAGRGRMGRSYYSAEGLGVYLSVILRPGCTAESLMHLTCAVAVAVCDATQNTCGIRPGVKWINDLIIGSEKVGGILTELSIDPSTGLVNWAVVGIGINCNHGKSDFPQELQGIATSIRQAVSSTVSPALLSANLIVALETLSGNMVSDRTAIMDRYRRDCITTGQRVMVIRQEKKQYAIALSVNDHGSLAVRFDDGSIENIATGEVSVRGLCGYV